MNVAFLTEMGFRGKIPADHPNMRTEFAWMHHMEADHYSIYSDLGLVNGYDEVFIIFPKGLVFLNAVGSKLSNASNPISELLKIDVVSQLKGQGNQKISYVQEGPHWLWNDYEIADQIGFYNFLSSCDKIYAHNKEDSRYYRGMFPHVKVDVMKTAMVETLIKDITSVPEEKVMIGGNFARWYGGFESYIVASEFGLPIWTQTSHAKREHEEYIDGLYHLPRLNWVGWMKELSRFKYTVHLMPTAAAGTFSLNCAYFGIPTIGNVLVDTQRLCHPNLSVEVHDIEGARELARQLRDDPEFYQMCSDTAKLNYTRYFSMEDK
jgi:hypothetical protein